MFTSPINYTTDKYTQTADSTQLTQIRILYTRIWYLKKYVRTEINNKNIIGCYNDIEIPLLFIFYVEFIFESSFMEISIGFLFQLRDKSRK